MISPCKNVCHLRGTLCVGCFRNIDEIIDWGKMDMNDRLDTIEEIKNRAKCPECGKWNKCAMEEGKSANTCWCFSVDVPPDLAEDIAFTDYNQCYCKTCLNGMMK